MKSLVSLLGLLASASVAVQQPPSGDGPRGTSQGGGGESRYDAVVRADVAPGDGISVATSALPDGSVAELTSLNSGRTIIALVTSPEGTSDGTSLSPAAATALGVTGPSLNAVRVRAAVASPQEAAMLRRGSAAAARADAPPALLAALRKRLTQSPTAPARSRTASPQPKTDRATVRPAVRAGFAVQVAALSTAARAASVAQALGGSVLAGPPVWRVRVGPYASEAEAGRVKTDLIRRGYAGAQIIRYP